MKKLLLLLLCISASALAISAADQYKLNLNKLFFKDSQGINNKFNLVTLYTRRSNALAVQDTINSPSINKDFHSTDKLGRNAIWYAAALSNNTIYDILLKNGADPNLKSTQGPLAGFSASQLHNMTREQLDAKLLSETG